MLPWQIYSYLRFYVSNSISYSIACCVTHLYCWNINEQGEEDCFFMSFRKAFLRLKKYVFAQIINLTVAIDYQ